MKTASDVLFEFASGIADEASRLERESRSSSAIRTVVGVIGAVGAVVAAVAVYFDAKALTAAGAATAVAERAFMTLVPQRSVIQRKRRQAYLLRVQQKDLLARWTELEILSKKPVPPDVGALARSAISEAAANRKKISLGWYPYEHVPEHAPPTTTPPDPTPSKQEHQDDSNNDTAK